MHDSYREVLFKKECPARWWEKFVVLTPEDDIGTSAPLFSFGPKFCLASLQYVKI